MHIGFIRLKNIIIQNNSFVGNTPPPNANFSLSWLFSKYSFQGVGVSISWQGSTGNFFLIENALIQNNEFES